VRALSINNGVAAGDEGSGFETRRTTRFSVALSAATASS
jgi:hypothetical protein